MDSALGTRSKSLGVDFHLHLFISFLIMCYPYATHDNRVSMVHDLKVLVLDYAFGATDFWRLASFFFTIELYGFHTFNISAEGK